MDDNSAGRSGRKSLGKSSRSEPDSERREFISTASTVVMAGGMLAGYGTFFAMAGRYVFPTPSETPWLFVTQADRVAPGESLSFESPTGVKVTVARRSGDSVNIRPAETEDFIALSSICPHLGCRVHWELQNKRFFCPCHNGVFDPEGKAVSGPPQAAGQELSRYPLKIEDGLLYISMRIDSVGSSAHASRSQEAPLPQRPGSSRIASKPIPKCEEQT